MQFSLLSFVALLAATSVNATVYLGLRTNYDGHKSQVACGFSTIVDSDSNPCGRNFYVDGNNGPFRFEGCGGNGLTLFRNGQFNSNCKFQSRTINCNGGAKIAQAWVCN
ncbi:conserved hypothetical protein [Aspergillus fumigatus Af293]|uniref:Uncharacterized protein n=1 Tax=Aspergillus fumigatus (strain ATCC MYA-4609 / CBS 101355 / FGSC A1100 / Af293) TaxID=330879 RepID=Q4WP78_ASPFU|nr:conserved hypothetical protein [Aspergillus fumigatus Af293]EAL89956.1 conserved hypothetical protein [Aspergillus fumigatus Af293]KEY76118.1 hypothetical protein BA78_8564 [Aspergillus fumigatus]